MSERVMVIKGLPSQIHAALSVAVTLLAQNLASKTPEAQPQVTLKLLIHKFLAGCIIGPAGAIMREIQNAFSVRVSVSTEALPGSTEKTCSIIGAPSAICAALERVIDQLTSNPLRAGCSTVLYVPGAPFAVPGPTGYGTPAIPGYPPDAMFRPNVPGQRVPPPRGPFGSQVPSHLQKSEKVIIPDSCSGVVIGKGGAIIKHIKARTDTNISLADPDEAHDRVVTISGSPQGIQAAIAMIRERVENYHPMREVPRYQ
jgi:rRNA processing protein Krr1/Pno1